MTRIAHLIIEHPAWRTRYNTGLRRALRATLDHEGVDSAELSFLLTGDAHLRMLNLNFRGKDAPTNVLSFPSGGGEYLGDIALSLDTLAREAEEQGKPFEHHLAHLAVHAVLHMLGYDHEADAQAEVMEAKEIEILAGLGIANPYL